MISNFIKSILGVFNKILFLLIVAIIVVFCLNNQQLTTISIKPLPFEIEIRLFLVILFCLFGGVLIGSLFSSLSLGKERLISFGKSWKIKFLERKVKSKDKKLKKELTKDKAEEPNI